MQYFYNPLCHVIYGRVKVPTGHQRLTDFERQTTRLETPAFVTANVACRRSVLEQVGGFDEQYKVAWREDSDLEFALLSNGKRLTMRPTAWYTIPFVLPAGVSALKSSKIFVQCAAA
ncbi:hypothetical protein LWM68_16530 [Niabella sp. W65]|nr:hypothetical protein [Niabella sp. W65]MCH7364220.1 hypothetical protein [Niabella sp. W65]ULT40090.1 hypothetical protein KRR40_35375 [Niabella sp. I65]